MKQVPDLLACVDLLVDEGDGLKLTDLKTARSRWSREQVQDSAGQLLLYHELAKPIADGRWKVEESRLRSSLQVPPNTTALFLAPTKDAGSVRESGRPAAASPGVCAAGVVGSRAAFRIASGSYEFELPR